VTAATACDSLNKLTPVAPVGISKVKSEAVVTGVLASLTMSRK
jgi:hypothetical protein